MLRLALILFGLLTLQSTVVSGTPHPEPCVPLADEAAVQRAWTSLAGSIAVPHPGLLDIFLPQFDRALETALGSLSERQRYLLLEGLAQMDARRLMFPEALQIEMTAQNQWSRGWAAIQARVLTRLAALKTDESNRIMARSVIAEGLFPRGTLNPDGTEASVASEWLKSWFAMSPTPERRRAIEETIADFRQAGDRYSVRAAELLEGVLHPSQD